MGLTSSEEQDTGNGARFRVTNELRSNLGHMGHGGGHRVKSKRTLELKAPR